MNIFSSLSRTTDSETIISRFVALLAIGVLSALPAVAGANSITKADLFSGAKVEPLSTTQMSETRGQVGSGGFLDQTDILEIASYYGTFAIFAQFGWYPPPGITIQNVCHVYGCPGGAGYMHNFAPGGADYHNPNNPNSWYNPIYGGMW